MKTEVLKETHRSDLHQLLAYCSFEPQQRKVGILFYLSQETMYRVIDYSDRLGGVSNRVILYGLHFGIREMKDTIMKVKIMFQKLALQYTDQLSRYD